jgi:hypothetical protein
MSGTITQATAPHCGKAMASSEAAHLEILWKRNVCPYCSGIILEGKRVGSGRKSDGGFCSLDCFSKYHVLELAEKARLLQRSFPPPQ